jgi:Ala-tRNA(Pro) deacylase
LSDQQAERLDDGSIPATPEELFRHLTDLGIDVNTVRHAPVFTVEEAKAARGELTGGHSKNLFLRNKKGRMWLVVAEESKAIDLKELGACIDAGRLSFGSPERLMRHLGVIPGAVTPFAVMNDPDGLVRVVLDRGLLDYDVLSFHPLDNTKTTTIRTDDLLRFLDAVDHPPQIVSL